MKKHFKDLFKYNDWANQKLFIVLQKSEISDEKILKLFGHLLTAQIIWYNRIKDIPNATFPLWDSHSLSELEEMLERYSSCWIKYMNEHRFDTFEEMIFYKSSEGKKFESTIGEIITQVINHGTHHRGQIVSQLRSMGVEPPELDYIFYRRQR